jgi:hypothetical protein
MIVAVTCVAASFERLRRVHRAAAFDFATLSAALGRSADAALLSEMRDLLVAEGASWEGELVTSALAARNVVDRTALVNEHLSDVGSELGWGKRIPRVAAWISWLSALCVLFFARAGGPVVFTDIVPTAGWAALGVFGALLTGREADRVEGEVRKGIDAWVARVLSVANPRDATE